MKRKVRRLLLAKGGLDGHTRGIEIIAENLRDAGFEVIYLGMYQASEAIAAATFQEDPDVVCVSVLSGGHRGVFRRLMSLLKQSGEDWRVIAGGIFSADDQKIMRGLGVALFFGPGASIKNEILPAFHALEAPVRSDAIPDLHAAFVRGDRRALAKYLTLLFGKSALAHFELRNAPQPQDAAPAVSHIVGFTGSGGAGKSSLIAHLTRHVYREHTVAALFVDPVSLSGGAILGDRIRLHLPVKEFFELVTSERVFLRSVAAQEVWHGVTSETPGALVALGQAGFSFVFLESVGVGQYNLGFKEHVDTMVFVTHPDMGDEIQLMKGGSIEAADVIAVNYADRPGSDAKVALLKRHFSKKRSDGWKVPVVRTIAVPGIASGSNSGIPELWQEIENHKTFLAAHKKRPK